MADAPPDARARWRLVWQAVRTLYRIDAPHRQRGRQKMIPAAACGRVLVLHDAMGWAAFRAKTARLWGIDELEARTQRPYYRIRYARLPLAELEGRCPDCRWPFRKDGCAPGMCSRVEF